MRYLGSEGHPPLPEQTVLRMFDVPVMRVEALEIRLREPELALEVTKYLDTNDLPDEKWEVRKVKNWATCFTLIDEVPYRQGFLSRLRRRHSTY